MLWKYEKDTTTTCPLFLFGYLRYTESYRAAPLGNINNNKSATHFANLPLLKGHGSKTFFWIFAMSSFFACKNDSVHVF
jgi:hypothetical protein